MKRFFGKKSPHEKSPNTCTDIYYIYIYIHIYYICVYIFIIFIQIYKYNKTPRET